MKIYGMMIVFVIVVDATHMDDRTHVDVEYMITVHALLGLRLK